jgi:RNA polymerase sigma-70 factor (ECF subfamily)
MTPQPANTEHLLRLWVRNQADIYRYIFALLPNASDAHEVLQSTCVALWRKADSFDLAKPFLPLAFRFAFLEVKKHREKNHRWNAFLRDEALELVAAERANRHPELELRRQSLDHCLGKLPPLDRDLIDRHYHRQQTVPVIADQTGRNVHTLYKSLQHIRRVLLDCIAARAASSEELP